METITKELKRLLVNVQSLGWDHELFKEMRRTYNGRISGEKDYYIRLEKYSPTGELFSMVIGFDKGDIIGSFLENIEAYLNEFDICKHAMMWVPVRGEYGCPQNISNLIEDAKSIKNMILRLLEEAKSEYKKNIVWTFFVLDFDGTYSNELPDIEGVQPSVYLIPLDEQKNVEAFARIACSAFHSEENQESDMSIGDYFEELLKNNGIKFKYVGSIDLTFGERQVDYLADYIPREIV